jgi:hypothetical protein
MTTTTAADACPICGHDDCDHTDEEMGEAAARQSAGQPAVYNASEPSSIARAAKRAKLGDTAEVDGLKWTMRHASGRAFVWAILQAAHVDQASFNLNTHVTAYREGERANGLRLVRLLMAHATRDYALMVAENGGSNVS